ncbi:Hypothetical protein GL50581_4630 [Giardia duodenalis ATCC 50581]|uniref:Uncharacterized protein n=1 Tax=Giardia intestinalis (strain ATCC 50581 / GS clone H7) TaxID=598745 RepID=C6LX51_GIAIB|nr:Hypothetical protein GL50581_4630 [Giardia intestinalis ATCC 50581]
MSGGRYAHNVLVQPSAILQATYCSFTNDGEPENLVLLRSGLLEVYLIEGAAQSTRLEFRTSYQLPPYIRKVSRLLDTQTHRDLIVVSSETELLFLDYDTVLRKIFIKNRRKIDFPGRIQLLESPDQRFIVCWSSAGILSLYSAAEGASCTILRGLPAIHELVDVSITTSTDTATLTDLGLSTTTFLFAVLWADSAHDMYIQMFALTDPSASQASMLKEITRKIPIPSQYCFVRPFGRGDFIVVGPSSLFVLSAKTIDVTPTLHPCASPTSLSNPYTLATSLPKSLFLHDRSGLLLEILFIDDLKRSASQALPLVMRYWGIVSSSLHSVLIRSDVLFLCSYSGPSLLLYVDWNKCKHFSFSLKDTLGVSDSVAAVRRSADREDHCETASEVFPDDSVGIGHKPEALEPRTFQYLSSSILANNSQLKCATPLILAQITHKGPIVDICYIPIRTTGLFEHNYIRLETPLLSSSELSLNKSTGHFSRLLASSLGHFDNGTRRARQQNSFSPFSGQCTLQFNASTDDTSIANLDDLMQWAFQQTRYSKVIRAKTQAYGALLSPALFSTESAICTISGSDHSGSINLYQRKFSHKFSTPIHLPGVLSISRFSSNTLLLRICNQDCKKFGSVILQYWYDNEFTMKLLSGLSLPIDLYNFESYPICAYSNSHEFQGTTSSNFVLMRSPSSLSVIELDTDADRVLTVIYSTTIKDFLFGSLSCSTEEEVSTFKQLPQTYFSTVNITALAVSPNGYNIVIALSNGAIITSRFILKDHTLEAIRYKRFSVSDAFLPHNSQVTFNIYSIAVSDEGCVSVCCLGVPYVFLLDMDLRHILDHPSGDFLYIPPCNGYSSSDHVDHSGTEESIRGAQEDNTLSNILAGSSIQAIDDIALLVQLNPTDKHNYVTESECGDIRFAACPYSHNAALKLSTPTELKFVGPSCLVMLSLDGTVHIYAIGKACIGKQVYFICDRMYNYKFSYGETVYLSILKQAESLKDAIYQENAELYLSSKSRNAIMYISLSQQSNVSLGLKPHSPSRAVNKAHEPNSAGNALSFVSEKMNIFIKIFTCVDKFSAILPLSQVKSIPPHNKPFNRAQLIGHHNEQKCNLHCPWSNSYIVYNIDKQSLSLAQRIPSAITCSSTLLPGLPRRLAHIAYYGMLCVGFHSLRPLSSGKEAKDPATRAEINKTSSVVNLKTGDIAEGADELSIPAFQESPVEHYSYSNVTRTFDMLTANYPKCPISMGTIPEALVSQSSYAALRFFTYNLHSTFTVPLPDNAIISGLQYIPLRSDKLPFIVVSYNLPSTEQVDAEDGFVAVYNIKTLYSPKEEYTLELVANFLFSNNTVCDIAPYTNHRIAVSLRTAAVILALITEKDLAKEDISKDTSGLYFGQSMGKPFMSTEYQLLEVYSCTGPALLLKLGTAYSQMTLLDMLKGVTLMNDGLGLACTALDQPRLVIQSQLLQRMIPACIYQTGIDGPILVGDRAGYIHIIKLHSSHGLKTIVSHYVGEQVVCFSPAPGCRGESATIAASKAHASEPQLVEPYPPILYATIGGQIGVIIKVTEQCSTLLRLVENVMQQKGQAHRDSDALIDLCALERYKCLDEDEKQLIVASLLSAKFDGLTTDVLAETIGKTVEFAAPW